jgi:LmbE family N-acetylglucosaminyl deacetylase
LPPFARHHHTVWQLGRDVVAARRAEDIAACGLLGADWWHGSLPDCIYRRDPRTGEPLYNDDEQLFGPVASAEIPLITTLADQFRRLPSADTVLVPLTIGGHVDHRLVRAAAELAWPARRLAWYDDYPYVQRAADDNGWAGLRIALAPQIVPLDGAAVRQRIAAIAAFRSQMVHLFEGEAVMARLVREEIGRIGGERLWYQPNPA